jgi:fibronectin-binding autotransporter adhesin
MKKILIFLSVFIFAFVNVYSQSLTVATVTGTTGQVNNVGVSATGIDEMNAGTPIVAFQIKVTYQTSIATFLQSTNFNATLTAGGSFTSSTINGGTVIVLWEATDIATPVSVPDDELLFNMSFNASGAGTSPLNLIEIEMLDVNGNALSVTLNNGSITFGAPAASTTWSGTGVWYTPANWSNGLPGVSTDAVIASGVVTVDAATAYTKNLSISAGAGLTVNTGKTVSANGNIVLESSANATATGSLLNNGTVTRTGTTTVKRYLSAGVQHFVSIPLTSATIQNFIYSGNSGYMFKYNEPTGAWENLIEPTTQIGLAIGYALNYTNAQTVSISGALNNDAAYAPTLTRTASNGWNFVGNPYSCPLDWAYASGWTKTNLDNAIYIWNGSVYSTYVVTGDVGTNGGSRYIPQFQGFFVHASAASPAISIKKAARTQSGNSTNFKNTTETGIFRLAISNGTYSEETVVYMNEAASSDFDGEYDAYKLFGFNEDVAQIYTSSNDVDYTINAQPVVDSLSTALNFRIGQSGTYTLTASGMESFNGDYLFIVKDNETGMSYNLKQNHTLTLTLNQGDIVDRFTLTIYKNTLGIEDNELKGVNVYAADNKVYIENCPDSDVNVYSATGALVASRHFGKAYLNSMVMNVPAGIYMVKLVSKNGTISSKLFIQ